MKTFQRFAVSAAALLAANDAFARVVTKSVVYEHAGTKLEGFLAYDDAKTAKGKLPGVLVIPEWWGLNAFAKGRAVELAARGDVALAVDMYGQGVVTEDPKKAGELAGPFYGKPLMAERANAGLEQLLKTGLVDSRKVAAIGFCFGGSTAQALAYSGAPLAGLVSFHGGPVDAPASAGGDAKVDDQSGDYAGAVHAFTNPDADRLAAAGGMKGMIGYNEPAARRSWKAMQVFFEEIFSGH